MAYTDTARLFTILTRHAIYVESVKAGTDPVIDVTQAKLRDNLTQIFGRLKFNTMDEMTKAQMRALVIQLKDLVRRHYSKYAVDMMDMIEQFMRADVFVQRSMMTAVDLTPDEQADVGDDLADVPTADVLTTNEDDNDNVLAYFLGAFESAGATAALAALDKAKVPFDGTGAGNSKLWAQLKASLIPADGQTMVGLMNNFVGVQVLAIQKAIQKAYVNGDAVKETLKGIIDDFTKQARQAATVTHTIIQHVTSSVSAGVQSVFFDYYQWVSVMDGRTSDICQHRNGKVYAYGSGPLPPAHYRCRSKIIPLPTSEPMDVPDMAEWLAAEEASGLGEMRNGKYFTTRSISLSKYVASVADILK